MDSFFTNLFLMQQEVGTSPGGARETSQVGTQPAAPPSDGGAGGRSPGCGGLEMIWLVVMIAVFWLVLIRPQQKRAKQQQKMISELKRGDRVITSGGIFGRITAIEGNALTLEIAKNTQIKILKSHVGGTATEDTEKELAKTAASGEPPPNPS